jgi:hypothetical protein
MKKMKVTRRPGSGANFTLYPSRVRIALIYASFFTIAVLVGLLIRIFTGGQYDPAVLFGDWAINLGIIIGGAVLFALMDYKRWTIQVIARESIEGPSGPMGERSQLPLKDIDWSRSGKSLRSRFKVGNAIYTLDRKRILISPWFYDPASYAQFKEQIGFSETK